MEAKEVRWLDELHTCMSHIAVMFEVCSHRESFAYIIHACMHFRSRPGGSRSRSRDGQPRFAVQPRPPIGGYSRPEGVPSSRPRVINSQGLPGPPAPPPGGPRPRINLTPKAPMCPPPPKQGALHAPVPPTAKARGPLVVPGRPGCPVITARLVPPGELHGERTGGRLESRLDAPCSSGGASSGLGLPERQSGRLKDARAEANAKLQDARKLVVTCIEEARRVYRQSIAEGRLDAAAVDAEEAAALAEARVLCILQMRCYVVF